MMHKNLKTIIINIKAQSKTQKSKHFPNNSACFFGGADNLCLQLHNFSVCTVLLRLQIILLNINGASSAQSRYVGQRELRG